MKLFNHSQRGLLYSEKWPEEPTYCTDFGDIILVCEGTFCKCKSQLNGFIADKERAISSSLKVANDVEVSRWIATSGLDANDIISDNCIVKLKPDTFYEIPGATAETQTLNAANCSYAFIHLPQENKPENSDPFNHTDSLIKELEFVKTSNREICIELESLRKENRELKSKLEYILSEIDSVGEYHPNYSGEIEDIRNLIQKHS